MLGTIIPAEKCEVCSGTKEVYLRLVTIPNDDPKGPPNKGSVDLAFCNKCRALWDKRDKAFCAKAQLIINAKLERKMQESKHEVPRYISMDFPILATLSGVLPDTIEEVQAGLYDEWLKGNTASDGSKGLTMHFMLNRLLSNQPLSKLPGSTDSELRQRKIQAFRKALRSE